MVSFQTLGRRRTSGIENGLACHSTLATAALVSVCVAVSSAAILLDVSFAPVSARAAAVEGTRARVPVAATLPKNILRVTFEVIAFTSFVAAVGAAALHGLDCGEGFHLIFVGRKGAGEVADEVIPAAAGHVLRGRTIAVGDVGNKEQIEVFVAFDQRIDDEERIVWRHIVV